MIVKPITKSIKIVVCEALLRRLQPSHPELATIKDDFGSESSGYYGEKSLDYYLKPLPEKRYHLLYGLRLSNGQYFFQIDTLLISPNFMFILEAKNYGGTVFLDSKFEQLIQEKGDSKKVYQDPVLQVERQKLELSKWLKTNGFPEFPLQSLVVFTNRKCILTTSTDNNQIYRKVCRSSAILNRIESLEMQITEEKLDKKTISKLTRLLLKHHTPQTSSSILTQYGITSKDILTGVQCPICNKIPMQYSKGIWKCPTCLTRSKNAHEQAIQDYFLLIKPTITNSELRHFLHLQHEKTAQRILKALKLPYSGETKGRVYHKADLL